MAMKTSVALGLLSMIGSLSVRGAEEPALPDFFLCLSCSDVDKGWWNPDAKDAPEELSVYRECGWRLGDKTIRGINDLVAPQGAGKGGNEKDGYAVLLPEEERRKTPYRYYDLIAKWNPRLADRIYSESGDVVKRPFIQMHEMERPAFRLNEKYPLADREDYAKWRKAHPNCLGSYVMCEFDSDLAAYYCNFPYTKDTEALKRLQAAFPCTFKDYAWDVNIFDRWVEEAFRRSREFCFGEENLWAFSSGTPGMVPIFAKAGVKGVCYEATTQGGGGNWRIANAYLKGAAKQFGIDYSWYTASFYTGAKRGSDTIESGENNFGPPMKGYDFFGPWRGASLQIIDRQNAYGWLIGARYTETENAGTYHVRIDKDGKRTPMSAAYDYQRLHTLAKTVDRGTPVSPLGLAFPFHDKLGYSGSPVYFTAPGPSGVVLTLSPGDHRRVKDMRLQGGEGGFYNSEFPDFYNIVTPDAYNDVEKAYAALKPYPAIVMSGRFRPETTPSAAFTRYVEEGGLLYLSEEYVREGTINAKLTGVSFPAKKVFGAGDWLIDETGKKTALEAPYVFKAGEPTTAKLFWKDENGAVIAYVNDYGKGKVITVTATAMLPDDYNRGWGINDPLMSGEYVHRLSSGKVKCNILREIFRRERDRLMPVEVAGDIHYGLNKTKKGYLIWFFNNKGITNFIGEEPQVDHAFDEKVTFAFKNGFKPSKLTEVVASAPVNPAIKQSGNQTIPEFSLTVPAGLWRAVVVE